MYLNSYLFVYKGNFPVKIENDTRGILLKKKLWIRYWYSILMNLIVEPTFVKYSRCEFWIYNEVIV